MDKIKNQLAGVAALLGVIAAIGGGFVKYGEGMTKLDSIETVDYSNSISQLGVYPIPAKHELNVDLELGQSELVTVSIYNLIGELMVTNSYEMSKGINTLRLDIDGLKDGVYLCKVNSGNNQMTRKFNVLK